MAAGVNVVVHPDGIKEMEREDLVPWLQTILETAATEARGLVNVDSGRLRSSITTRLTLEPFEGHLEANTNYAAYQELEPDDASAYVPVTTTATWRRTPGGRAYLRPGALKGIRDHT
jgi:hypothetical protein